MGSKAAAYAKNGDHEVSAKTTMQNISRTVVLLDRGNRVRGEIGVSLKNLDTRRTHECPGLRPVAGEESGIAQAEALRNCGARLASDDRGEAVTRGMFLDYLVPFG
jgi:hypothetical protein